jgi:hypothetical protein
MSLFGNIFRAAAPIVGGFLGGPAGAAVGAAIAGAGSSSRATVSAAPALPGIGFAPQGVGGTLPSLPGFPTMGSVAAVGGAVVRAGAAGVRLAISSARYYCARYPSWCIAVGGLGAVQGMVSGGQLPPHRRRRRRGISAREFGAFRKVHRVLSGFCAPRMRIRRRK